MSGQDAYFTAERQMERDQQRREAQAAETIWMKAREVLRTIQTYGTMDLRAAGEAALRAAIDAGEKAERELAEREVELDDYVAGFHRELNRANAAERALAQAREERDAMELSRHAAEQRAQAAEIRERDAKSALARASEALMAAACSLDVLSHAGAPDGNEYLREMDQVRGFAGSRAAVAHAALASSPVPAAPDEPAPPGRGSPAVFSRWVQDQLVWTINGEEVTDADLRRWCGNHMEYPWRHVDIVRRIHVEAYARRNESDPSAPPAPAADQGEALRLREQIRALISQSEGVAGLHLNGEVAPWEWLIDNGWLSALSAAPAPSQALGPRIMDFAVRMFGPGANNRDERALRLMEEAIELAQAEGVSREQAAGIVSRTYDRPVGSPKNEGAQVALCLVAWAQASGYDAMALALHEMERIEALPPEHWHKRHAAKTAAGLTLTAPSPAETETAPGCHGDCCARGTWEFDCPCCAGTGELDESPGRVNLKCCTCGGSGRVTFPLAARVASAKEDKP